MGSSLSHKCVGCYFITKRYISSHLSLIKLIINDSDIFLPVPGYPCLSHHAYVGMSQHSLRVAVCGEK